MVCVRAFGSSKFGPFGEINFGQAYMNRSSNVDNPSSLIMYYKR